VCVGEGGVGVCGCVWVWVCGGGGLYGTDLLLDEMNEHAGDFLGAEV
jgi:hypothetical protein